MANETIEGVVDNYGAKHMNDANPAHVSVWDCDGNVLFTLPAGSTAEHVNCAIQIHEQSYRAGLKFGAADARHQIRKALGL
jgi:hypothetical protein